MKKRTRQQKIKAAQRRTQVSERHPEQPVIPAKAGIQEFTTRHPELVSGSAPTTGSKDGSRVKPGMTAGILPSQSQVQRDAYAHELFHFDTNLIYGDLRKTLVLVTSIFIFLGVIARFWLGR